MRLTLVIYALDAGGAEGVLSLGAISGAGGGREVTLLTLDDGREPPFYPLHAAVRHRALGVAGRSANPGQAVRNNLHRVLVLRRAIRATRPDVVVAFLDQMNVLTLLACTGLPVPVIVSERTNPYRGALGLGWRSLRALLYPCAACVVVQTAHALGFFSSRVQARTRVIANPVAPPPADSVPPAGAVPGLGRVLAMGRLETVKGFDLLIAAFAQVAEACPGWMLEIWGEGPQRTALEAQIADLGLAGRVGLPGRTQEPARQMRRADLFVLSSRFEGFPNVLCEALACGLPAISFDCHSGPREIIREGVDGVLVPAGDVAELAAALARLMGDPCARRRLAARAPEVLQRFSLEEIGAQWDELIRSVCGERRAAIHSRD